MNTYLVKKLGEEGSEVAQAAFKVLLHADKQTRRALLSEVADMEAITVLLRRTMSVKARNELNKMVLARVKREESKGKA